MRVRLTVSAPSGTVTAPPSKSMAHRALVCAACAQGESLLQNVALSQDILATQEALRALGAHIENLGGGQVRVRGIGGAPTAAPAHSIDCGESGSTLRFLIPLFSLCGAPVRFCGHGRLPQRPQQVYAQLFAQQGLRFEQDDTGLTLCGALQPGDYALSGGVSSQFISGLLFALPLMGAPGRICVQPPFESRSYVELTRQAMADFGVDVTWQDANTLLVPSAAYKPCSAYTVEGDYSQAAFFAVLGAVCGGIAIAGLRPDSRQGDRAVLDILQRCGAVFAQQGDCVVFQKSTLHATDIDLADCPDLGPILMVLGLFCQGETVIRNAGRLRIKESDRIAAMEQEVAKLGGVIRSDENTVWIQGGALHGADDLTSHNDHRIAMALAVAALAARIPATIYDAQAVCKSYPDFWQVLAALGAEVTQDETA